MAINDPYDRSGQYSGGDTGPKVGGYGGLANENPDRRDVAIGTMAGEAGPWDNREGYAGVLDTIENRISAAQRGENYGQRKGDTTLEGIAQARAGKEYNAWSQKHGGAAFGIATRAAAGKPQGKKEGEMYDLAREVYDDYYRDPNLKGIAKGGTFYQNDAFLKGKPAGAWQRNMQSKYGSVPIGIAGHVATGPGLNLGRPGAAYEAVDPAITGSFGQDVLGQGFVDTFSEAAELTGQEETDELGGPMTDTLEDGAIKGGMGTDQLDGGIKGLVDPMTSPVLPGAVRPAAATVRTAAPQRAAAAPSIAPRESYWSPGPVARAKGSGATGMETYRTADGVIHDRGGMYGGRDAFGPNDPFGGLGFSTKGYADVVDTFDRTLGTMTRTVTDRYGNVIDEATVGLGGMADPFAEIGVDGVRSDGRGSADTGFSGGSLGDGSYSSSSGFNDNSPQGIL